MMRLWHCFAGRLQTDERLLVLHGVIKLSSPAVGNDMLTTCKEKNECDVRARLCSPGMTVMFRFDFNVSKKDG